MNSTFWNSQSPATYLKQCISSGYEHQSLLLSFFYPAYICSCSWLLSITKAFYLFHLKGSKCLLQKVLIQKRCHPWVRLAWAPEPQKLAAAWNETMTTILIWKAAGSINAMISVKYFYYIALSPAAFQTATEQNREKIMSIDRFLESYEREISESE